MRSKKSPIFGRERDLQLYLENQTQKIETIVEAGIRMFSSGRLHRETNLYVALRNEAIKLGLDVLAQEKRVYNAWVIYNLKRWVRDHGGLRAA